MVDKDKPKIFLSHTTEDARIANALAEVIKRAYAGGIECWFSSDKSPAGGLAPGDQWYQRLHEQLSGANRVFVIVTPLSVSRPWIYWESAIGSVTCPGQVVPLVFGMQATSLEPPLNYFQGVDGLNKDDLHAALMKIAHDADLAPDDGFLTTLCSDFVGEAAGYVEPGPKQEESTEERLAAMLLGPLQNIQRRLEPLDALGRRLDMLAEDAMLSRQSTKRNSLSIFEVPVDDLDSLVRFGRPSPKMIRLLESGELTLEQVHQALDVLHQFSRVSPKLLHRAVNGVLAYSTMVPSALVEENQVSDQEDSGDR